MFSVTFNQLWALFNSFRGTGSNESKIHCFERFSKPPSHKQGGDQLTIITKTIRIVCTVWLMKIKNCPTSIKFLLQSTLCGVGLPVGGCCWGFCWEGKWCLQPSSSVVTGVSWSEKKEFRSGVNYYCMTAHKIKTARCLYRSVTYRVQSYCSTTGGWRLKLMDFT